VSVTARFKFVMFSGSRGLTGTEVERAVRELLSEYNPASTVVVVGDARGVDRVVQRIAELMGFTTAVFKANWRLFGPLAGPLRNAAMVKAAHEGHAVWDGRSRGTRDAIEKLRAAGKLGKVITIKHRRV